MAFTAGSVELAKAQRLAAILSDKYQAFGSTNFTGYTAAAMVEKAAKKLGFGITGLTTGAGFPAFGSSGLTANTQAVVGSLEARLQNPSGLTQPNGITVAAFANGATVGIYLRKFVRSGADVTVTSSSVGAVAGKTSESFAGANIVNGGFTASVFFGGSGNTLWTVS